MIETKTEIEIFSSYFFLASKINVKLSDKLYFKEEKKFNFQSEREEEEEKE